MKMKNRTRRLWGAGGFFLAASVALATMTACVCEGGIFKHWRSHHDQDSHIEGVPFTGDLGGTWYWLRSPEQEKRVTVSLYSRYCIRCHGIDGRGIWDMPDVPDFTNARWQATRSDGQLARAILEGRGACMPPFRGTMTLEEAWAMARYLRTFIPGTEIMKPDTQQPEQLPDPKLANPKLDTKQPKK
jgi:hypothetical protein